MAEQLLKANVEQELSTSYVTYAISTLNRSLPNAIDGLKVSQRRVIQTAFMTGLSNSKPFVKVAKLSGECIAKLHTAGGCGGTITQLGNASEFMQPLLQLHGNAGGHIMAGERIGQKLSEDGPAAERYLEVKLSAFSEAVFDIEHKYLQTRPSYDGQTDEIVQFVPALPLALVNAQTGIGTGYATNSIAFPLQSIGKAIKYGIDNLPTKVASALGIPDFTCYSQIERNDALLEMHSTGRATLRLSGTYTIRSAKLEHKKRNAHREQIVVTDLPIGSAERFLDKVKEACEQYKCTTIADIADLSNGEGIQIVITLKPGADAQQTIAELKRHTTLAGTYSVNNTFVLQALPNVYTPSQLLFEWLDARRAVLRTKYADLCAGYEARLHILEALLGLQNVMRKVVQDIMDTESASDAEQMLQSKYKLSQAQAQAVLAISLRQLTKLSKQALLDEQAELMKELAYRKNMLTDGKMLDGEILAHAESIIKKFARPRRTQIAAEPVARQEAQPAVAQQPAGATARQTFIEACSLGEDVAKSLWKHQKRLPKALAGTSLMSASNSLGQELDKIYKDGQATPQSVQRFVSKFGLIELNDRWLRKIAGNRALLLRHICWSLNQLGGNK